KRARNAIDGDWYTGFGKDAVQPPEAGARAIFVDRFHVPVALARPWRGAHHFRQEGLGSGVAMQDAVFAAFLVIDDELDGHRRAARPSRIRPVAAMAAHVTNVSHRNG